VGDRDQTLNGWLDTFKSELNWLHLQYDRWYNFTSSYRFGNDIAICSNHLFDLINSLDPEFKMVGRGPETDIQTESNYTLENILHHIYQSEYTTSNNPKVNHPIGYLARTNKSLLDVLHSIVKRKLLFYRNKQNQDCRLQIYLAPSLQQYITDVMFLYDISSDEKYTLEEEAHEKMDFDLISKIEWQSAHPDIVDILALNEIIHLNHVNQNKKLVIPNYILQPIYFTSAHASKGSEYASVYFDPDMDKLLLKMMDVKAKDWKQVCLQLTDECIRLDNSEHTLGADSIIELGKNLNQLDCMISEYKYNIYKHQISKDNCDLLNVATTRCKKFIMVTPFIYAFYIYFLWKSQQPVQENESQ
jgi:hypothetical protein